MPGRVAFRLKAAPVKIRIFIFIFLYALHECDCVQYSNRLCICTTYEFASFSSGNHTRICSCANIHCTFPVGSVQTALGVN